jgi:DNA-binding NtrC family response regulator
MCEQFHIPSDWPVLIVEDTEDWILWFRKRLPNEAFAKNAESAFQALGGQRFKVIFLDHDLYWMHADNSIFKGTGTEVARFIAKQESQGIVIIHSRHVEGAEAMKKYLPNARLAPFGSFEIVSGKHLEPGPGPR